MKWLVTSQKQRIAFKGLKNVTKRILLPGNLFLHVSFNIHYSKTLIIRTNYFLEIYKVDFQLD